ncbi:MAG: phosphate ABC transporter substrate-binding protein [Planctomycetota bacterium]
MKSIFRFQTLFALGLITLHWPSVGLGVLVAQPADGDSPRDVLDPNLETYTTVAGVPATTIKLVGSETMGRLVAFWAEDFQALYPNVTIEEDAKGSSNAFPALIAGQANWGMMSRQPQKSEVADFKDRYGYSPKIIPTSIDMLAVWVHKDNPVEGLSFPELDAIFSSTRKLGAASRAEKWGDFESPASFSTTPVTCFGRNAASGTYGFFKDRVLARGDYGAWVNELGGSSLVSQSVATNFGAIGYSGIGFRNAATKPLKISRRKGDKLVAPTAENALNGSYPLARYLYLIINVGPRQEMSPVGIEFLRYISSKRGQALAARGGYVPLNAEMVERAFAPVLKR